MVIEHVQGMELGEGMEWKRHIIVVVWIICALYRLKKLAMMVRKGGTEEGVLACIWKQW